MNKWMAEYEKQLLLAVEKFPKEYGFGPEMVSEVAGRMRRAFCAGTFDKDGRAIKATCKALGIKHTYKAIKEFISEGEIG